MQPTRTKRRGRPKNEQLTRRRREEILDAAAPIFAARGYPKTDVQVLADELGVGKGTVYRYFPTKRDLFLATVDRGMQRLKAQVDQARTNSGDRLEQVRAGIRAYLAFFDANPDFVELLIQERAEFKDRKKPTYFAYSEAHVGKWEETLRALIADGRVRDVPVARVREVVGDLLYGTIFTNYFAGRRRSFEGQADDLLDIVLYGILSDRERGTRGGLRGASAARRTGSREP
jgi:AcrR family transcriptional regulator